MNKTQLKQVNINFNGNSYWNPQKCSLLLKYDAESPTGFSITVLDSYFEPKVKETTEAKELLKKFTL